MSTVRSTHEVKLLANSMRHDIITMVSKAKSGHPGGSLSCTDILATLFLTGVMNYDEHDPKSPDRDILILSKGHAAPALYAAFHQIGWVRDDELGTLRQLGTRLQGHPDGHALPGVEVCSGSLGQGLSVSAGAALGFLADAPEGARPRHVFCVCGDGELQEGSNWEALMFAPNHSLSNLTMFLDLNNLQIDGDVRKVNSLGDIDAKLAAFGWHVIHTDGHDVERLRAAVEEALAFSAAPTAIVCDTVKGKGVSFMENEAGWHGKAPNEEETALALADLDAERAQIEKEA
ncbi:transketolase [Olsenella sp. Marseille-P4559]|uniref:transketolase n=1 Tax=Olsenella sp. Marseille-P4559 TaxID=2364795 RepID=UPI0010317D9C|nr:transketolase [Olsenella sp. Marseille-P4559]